MRTTIAFALPLALAATATIRARADDRQAREVIDQAIRSAGGEYRLLRTQAMTRTAKGVLFFFGQETPFSTQLTIAFPDRLRDRIEVEANRQKTEIVHVLNRDQGWRAAHGKTMEMTKSEVEELKEEAYVLWLTTLVPLRDKEFTLTSLADTKIDNRPAAVLQVARKDHFDAKLFFDKQTNVLAKLERTGRDAGLPVTKEYLFGGHREWNGIRMATRQTTFANGKKTEELTTTSYEFLDRLPDGTFAKP
jgi:hypothetical protein